MMWQFFSDSCKRALQIAHREALKMRSKEIGTAHLLLGIAAEGTSSAAGLLEANGVTAEGLRRTLKIDETIPEPDEQTDLPFSDGARGCLDAALNSARSLDAELVDPSCLLAAVLKVNDNGACRLLATLGVSPETLRERAAELLASSKREESPVHSPKAGNGEGDEAELAIIGQFCVDLTARAAAGELDPIVGRQKETRRLMQVLCRRTKNNPVLVGDPGVGKTAVVEGLAQLIQSEMVPDPLKGKKILQLNVGSLVAGAKYRGDFEERFQKLIAQVSKSKDILFIDEIHTLIGTGNAEGSLDAANMLKPSLARGELRIIGATTAAEYRRYIERDGALERRFQPIDIAEPDFDSAVAIVSGLLPRYEEHHGVVYAPEAAETAVRLSSRFLTDRRLPDKAIDLIDEAGAKAQLDRSDWPPELKEVKTRLGQLRRDKEAAILAADFELAGRFRSDEAETAQQLEENLSVWRRGRRMSGSRVGPDDLAQVLSSWCGVPVGQMSQSEAERLLTLESRVEKHLIGQSEAVSCVCRALRRNRSGLQDEKRPIGSFLFLGPSGVGKTELARVVARELYSSDKALIALDMSEFHDRYTVSRLIGTGPGYVGYEDRGQLTEAVRRHPYSVVLLDEIEKADPQVNRILLQIMEDGRLTDGHGDTVDFRNALIIMTSNLGSREAAKSPFGFSDAGRSDQAARGVMSDELKRFFPPELLGRMDDVVYFRRLNAEDLSKIFDLLLAPAVQRLKRRGIDFSVSPQLKLAILDEAARQGAGARPLRRLVEKRVSDPTAEWLIANPGASGDLVCSLEDGETAVRCQEGPAVLAALSSLETQGH